MSQLIAFCALPDGHVEGVVADVEETIDGQRCFRSGHHLVLQLPAENQAAIRAVRPRSAPAPRWDLLRHALRAHSDVLTTSDAHLG